MSSNQDGTSASILDATGISKLKKISKQMTVTRFNIQHPATMEDLPDEILVNIFIRLLAKQLAQMRSVSKSWNALLSHPSFVKSHLHRYIHNNNEQILLVMPQYYKPFKQYSCQSAHIEPINFIKHIPTNLPLCRVIGSVNGLICLSDTFYSNIQIWNPSLNAVATIPPPHFITSKFPYVNYIRFGFEPKTDDYKLVKISGIYDLKRVKEWLQVEVYSTRKRSWKFITQPFPSRITKILHVEHVCVDGHNGHLHWENITGSWTERTILAFDLGSETFREIPLPHSILDSNHYLHRLEVLDGKLCEMSWRKDGVREVWVMEEYGVHESWVKRHVLSQFSTGDWGFSYGFTSRNELLVLDKYRRLILYDPIANKTKSTHPEQKAMKIVEYVDSLVWI